MLLAFALLAHCLSDLQSRKAERMFILPPPSFLHTHLRHTIISYLVYILVTASNQVV